jgi:uncharacterized membrane protein
MARSLRRFHRDKEILMAKRGESSSGNFFIRQIKAHARLLIATAIGLIVWFAVPSGTGGMTRFLIGWNAAIWLFLLLALQMMVGATAADIKRRAGIEEEGRGMMLGLIVAASTATFIAIGSELSQAQSATGATRAFHIALALATIFGSWLFMNFAFATHYAHEFHTVQEGQRRKQVPLDFPGGGEPDYWDFLYFAMVIGTTFQTSDVEINSRMLRRNVLVHGLISFLYNTAVIALTVNIASQFFGGGK